MRTKDKIEILLMQIKKSGVAEFAFLIVICMVSIIITQSFALSVLLFYANTIIFAKANKNKEVNVLSIPVNTIAIGMTSQFTPIIVLFAALLAANNIGAYIIIKRIKNNSEVNQLAYSLTNDEVKEMVEKLLYIIIFALLLTSILVNPEITEQVKSVTSAYTTEQLKLMSSIYMALAAVAYVVVAILIVVGKNEQRESDSSN